MEAIKIVLLCVCSAIIYGIAQDQVTARVCVEYFTIGHPPLVAADDPTLLAFAWGTIATWWVGLLLGVPLALIARVGDRPKLSARQMVKPVSLLLLVVAVCSCLAGFAGYFGCISGGHSFMLSALTLPPDKQCAFLADASAHLAAYGFGLLGGVVLWVWAWCQRGKLPPSASRDEWLAISRGIASPLLIGLGPFVVMTLYLIFSRWPEYHVSEAGYWLALAVSIGSGLLGFGLLRIPWLGRALLACVYLPVLSVVLVVYSVYFLCFVFGACL